MNILQRIINYFRISTYITDDCFDSHKNIRLALKKQFPKASIFLTDDIMISIYVKDMKEIAAFNFGVFRKWQREKFDCEDKSRVMCGLMAWLYGQHAFGMVFVHTPRGNHALNCFIDEFGRFNYFEPQSNSIFRTKKAYVPYLIVI